MQKWEYQLVKVSLYTDESAKKFTEHINRLGDDGWELAATASHEYNPTLIFKRPKS